MNVTHLNVRPANEADGIRATLATAIDQRNGLDKQAADKREIADRAKQLTFEASQHVERLRTEQEAKTAEQRALHSKAISEALRHDRPVPPRPGPAATDTVALKVAEEQLAAFETSSVELSFEAQEAASCAAKAHMEVEELVSVILDGEACALGRELVEATELGWRLLDRLAGLAQRDDKRSGGPKLHDMQRELISNLDRRKAACARNPLYLEGHNWQDYLTGLTNAEEAKWQSYAERLAVCSVAVFEE